MPFPGPTLQQAGPGNGRRDIVLNIDERIEEMRKDLEEAVHAVKLGNAEKAQAGLVFTVGRNKDEEVEVICQRKGAPRQTRTVMG